MASHWLLSAGAGRSSFSMIEAEVRGRNLMVAATPRNVLSHPARSLPAPVSLIRAQPSIPLGTSTIVASQNIHTSASSGGNNSGATNNKWSSAAMLMATLMAAGSTSSLTVSEPKAKDKTESDDEGMASSSLPNDYDVSVGVLKGKRTFMEDNFFIGDGGRFAAVFDGHGGSAVSTILRERLYDSFIKYLHQQGGSSSLSCRVNAIRAAFGEVEQEVLEHDSLAYQGSTAVAVLVHEQEDGKRTLVSANIGDSRAILSRSGQAIALTRDHKPNELDERERILSWPGERIKYDFTGRIYRVRQLAVSRSIGDRYAKPIVTAEPEIKQLPVANNGDEFILLGSDGLFDVMTNQEAVSFVHRKLDQARGSKEERRKKLPHLIAQHAIKLGSMDNVCVAIVWLK